MNIQSSLFKELGGNCLNIFSTLNEHNVCVVTKSFGASSDTQLEQATLLPNTLSGQMAKKRGRLQVMKQLPSTQRIGHQSGPQLGQQRSNGSFMPVC
jgi:hypothetical protein